MSDSIEDKCLICGSFASVYLSNEIIFRQIVCEACGIVKFQRYSYNVDLDKLAAYLFYTNINKSNQTFFIGSKEKFDMEREREPQEYEFTQYVSFETVNNWYPATFSEKVDTIMLGLAKLSKYDGSAIVMSTSKQMSAFFTKRYNEDGSEIDEFGKDSQLDLIIGYLIDLEYIKDVSIEYPEHEDMFCFMILPKGLERIDELQKNKSNSKNVFIAMSFAENMKDIRNAIKVAVETAGYIPRIMDEIEHNRQIVPEMLYEIRNSNFVIAEISSHNNGAYFEAGYALGLGKEVIQICKKDEFGTKSHFDVKQVNTVLWESTEQLIEALVKRIKASIS